MLYYSNPKSYECVSKIFRTDAVNILNLTTKRVWKLPTSTHLRATWHTGSLDTVGLPSISFSRYHNCCTDGGTSPEYFGNTLLHVLFSWGSHSVFSYFKNITHSLLLLQLYTQKYTWNSNSRLIQKFVKVMIGEILYNIQKYSKNFIN
jgi:hypothetical protein